LNAQPLLFKVPNQSITIDVIVVCHQQTARALLYLWTRIRSHLSISS
jgi:hypothetical protein